MAADLFDGWCGQAVAASTYRRWLGKPERFRAVLIPRLCELDAEFREQHLQRIAGMYLIGPGLLEDLPEDVRFVLRRRLEARAAGMLFGQVAPGKVGRIG